MVLCAFFRYLVYCAYVANFLPLSQSNRNVDKVDTVMEDARIQLELTTEINEAISNPAGMGIDVRSILLVLRYF